MSTTENNGAVRSVPPVRNVNTLLYHKPTNHDHMGPLKDVITLKAYDRLVEHGRKDMAQAVYLSNMDPSNRSKHVDVKNASEIYLSSLYALLMSAENNRSRMSSSSVPEFSWEPVQFQKIPVSYGSVAKPLTKLVNKSILSYANLRYEFVMTAIVHCFSIYNMMLLFDSSSGSNPNANANTAAIGSADPSRDMYGGEFPIENESDAESQQRSDSNSDSNHQGLSREELQMFVKLTAMGIMKRVLWFHQVSLWRRRWDMVLPLEITSMGMKFYDSVLGAMRYRKLLPMVVDRFDRDIECGEIDDISTLTMTTESGHEYRSVNSLRNALSICKKMVDKVTFGIRFLKSRKSNYRHRACFADEGKARDELSNFRKEVIVTIFYILARSGILPRANEESILSTTNEMIKKISPMNEKVRKYISKKSQALESYRRMSPFIKGISDREIESIIDSNSFLEEEDIAKYYDWDSICGVPVFPIYSADREILDGILYNSSSSSGN